MASRDEQPSTSSNSNDFRIFIVGKERYQASTLLNLLKSKLRGARAQLNNIMVEAIKCRHQDIINFLLSNGMEIDVLNKLGQTAIHLTFYHNFLLVVNPLFCQCDLDKNYTDVNGLSHLHIACIAGNRPIVDNLIKHGADVNVAFHTDPESNWNNFTPLHFASKCARNLIVKMLLAHGADPNTTDKYGRTPLHFACNISMRTCQVLAKMITQVKEADKLDREIAVFNTEPNVVQMLVKNGADVNISDEGGNTPAYYLFLNDYIILMRMMKEVPPNFVYSTKAQRRLIREMKQKQKLKLLFLMSCGADVTMKNSCGETLLHRIIDELKFSRATRNIADICFDDETNCEVAEILLQAGTDVNAINGVGETALQMAVSLLSADIVKLLLRYNADKTVFKSFNYNHNLYFKYLNVLPCYEAVENLIEIIDILTENGLVLSLSEYLGILKFLIHNNASYAHLDMNDPTTFDKISNLLDYGTPTNIMDIIRRVDNRVFLDPSYYSCMFIKLMDTGKFYMNPQLSECIRKLAYPYNLMQINQKDYVKEVDKMKTIMLQNNKSLYDFMRMHPHQVFLKLTNNKYKEILRSADLKDEFFYYSGLIKGHFTKGLVRRFVVKAASDYIRVLTTSELPDLVCEKISSYLTNEELWTMCLAATNKLQNEQNRIRHNSS